MRTPGAGRADCCLPLCAAPSWRPSGGRATARRPRREPPLAHLRQR
ncbi:hypothetical protein [Ornithinimicrobium kibberense]